jgi:RNA polymerase sigma-70 factor (ECF subfamily)
MTSTDRQLLQAHVDGDPEAFGELFSRHRDRLWAVALRTTGNRDDAADALQDAMISAFRRAEGYRGDAAVTTWLHRIVVNACLDRLRANKVRAADALPDDLEERADRGSLRTADAATPDEEALTAERRRAVLEALATLPADQRAALVLVDMEGYGVAEAAEILDCAVGTVKSRCSRGRARLAPLLGVLREPDDHAPRTGNRLTASAVPSPEPARGPPTDAARPTAPTSPHAPRPTEPEGGEPPSDPS